MKLNLIQVKGSLGRKKKGITLTRFGSKDLKKRIGNFGDKDEESYIGLISGPRKLKLPPKLPKKEDKENNEKLANRATRKKKNNPLQVYFKKLNNPEY